MKERDYTKIFHAGLPLPTLNNMIYSVCITKEIEFFIPEYKSKTLDEISNEYFDIMRNWIGRHTDNKDIDVCKNWEISHKINTATTAEYYKENYLELNGEQILEDNDNFYISFDRHPYFGEFLRDIFHLVALSSESEIESFKHLIDIKNYDTIEYENECFIKIKRLLVEKEPPIMNDEEIDEYLDRVKGRFFPEGRNPSSSKTDKKKVNLRRTMCKLPNSPVLYNNDAFNETDEFIERATKEFIESAFKVQHNSKQPIELHYFF